MRTFLLVILNVLVAFSSTAQDEKRWIKRQINILSRTTMHGRGYVNKGVEKAADYLSQRFREAGLRSFREDSNYFQSFHFPVNTFPHRAYLKLQKKELIAGEDFIVNAASVSFNAEKIKVKTLDLKKVKDPASWLKFVQRLKQGKAYLLKNYDTAVKYLDLNSLSLGAELPRGLYIIPKQGKLTWTVAGDTLAATVFIAEDSVLPRRLRKATVYLDSKFIPSFESKNVIGYVPGTERKDSFIVVTAHFDHLGRLGTSALFPGAHDNASGTAVMLYLAQYFARHPQKYSMAFLGFSGEEAGLLGSKYFTEHPVFPLNNIRFVINLDMTGDATHGITVVNAVDQKKAFALLKEINNQKNYLPEIKERGQSSNSDHYYFSEKGIPAIFIYSNGTKPYYHDVFDKARELSLENIDGLVKLLIDFAGKL